MQKQERNKKLLIIMVVLCLFGTSYYYYIYKQKTAAEKQVIAPKKTKVVSAKIEISDKKDLKGEKQAAGKVEKQVKPPVVKPMKTAKVKNTGKKIKPTDKSDLIRMAFNSAGKNDPFSYLESNFSPFISANTGRRGSRSELPNPPAIKKKPDNYVEIKGFLGNKVIAEVNGLTDSLGTGETLRGVKVLRIDPKNLVCEFEIKGNKVTRKMQPVTKPDKNVDIKYIKQSQLQSEDEKFSAVIINDRK